MNIITKKPVIYKTSSADGDYSDLDGKSPSKQISFFQNWVNKFRGEKLKVDGKWGSKTANAWKKHGRDFEKAAIGANNLINSALQTGSGGGATPKEAQPGKPNTIKLRGLFEKAKEGFNKAKDAGLVDIAKQKLGLGTQSTVDNTGTTADFSTPITDGTKKGMPKALKIGLIVGIPLLLIGVYLVTKKKK